MIWFKGQYFCSLKARYCASFLRNTDYWTDVKRWWRWLSSMREMTYIWQTWKLMEREMWSVEILCYNEAFDETLPWSQPTWCTHIHHCLRTQSDRNPSQHDLRISATQSKFGAIGAEMGIPVEFFRKGIHDVDTTERIIVVGATWQSSISLPDISTMLNEGIASKMQIPSHA